MSLTERTSHPSQNQLEALIDFLEENPNLAKGLSKVPNIRDASRKAWEGLTYKLNNLEGCLKTWKQWTKYWADKKSAVKKKVYVRYKARKSTDGGFESVELSDVEERIVTLMGGESFLIGDRHKEIKPFTEPTSLHPSLLSDNNAILSLRIEQQRESSTASLIDVDIFTPTAEKPFIELRLGSSEPTPSQSNPSRTSGVHMVIRSTHEAQTPIIRSPSPVQPTTPSTGQEGTGSRGLDLSDVQAHTKSSDRQRPRHLKHSPPSQRNYLYIKDTFLKLEKQRIELKRYNSERQAEINLATAKALNTIEDALKLLAEALLNEVDSSNGLESNLPRSAPPPFYLDAWHIPNQL